MWTRTLSKLQLERSKVNLIFLSSFPDKTCWAKCRAIYRHWIFLDISNFMFLFLSSSFFHCFLFLFSLSDSVTFSRVQSNVQIQVFLLTFLLLISHIYLFFSHFSFSQFLISQILISRFCLHFLISRQNLLERVQSNIDLGLPLTPLGPTEGQLGIYFAKLQNLFFNLTNTFA